MILDSQSTFAPAQAITGNAISQNVIDVRGVSSLATQDEGVQGLADLLLHVLVTQTFNSLTSLTITLESDSAAALNVAPVVHWSSGAIALAALVAGATVVRMNWPSGDFRKYVGLRFTVTGTNPSQGALSAFMVTSQNKNQHFANGFSVS